MVIQTALDEWTIVENQIDRSKIKRYPYKKYMGISLTKAIIQLKAEGKTSSETLGIITKRLGPLFFENPDEINNIEKNLYISVCARYAEERTRGR